MGLLRHARIAFPAVPGVAISVFEATIVTKLPCDAHRATAALVLILTYESRRNFRFLRERFPLPTNFLFVVTMRSSHIWRTA